MIYYPEIKIIKDDTFFPGEYYTCSLINKSGHDKFLLTLSKKDLTIRNVFKFWVIHVKEY